LETKEFLQIYDKFILGFSSTLFIGQFSFTYELFTSKQWLLQIVINVKF